MVCFQAKLARWPVIKILSLLVLRAIGNRSSALYLLGVEHLHEEIQEHDVGEVQPGDSYAVASADLVVDSLVNYGEKAHHELDELDWGNEFSTPGSWNEVELNQGVVTVHDYQTSVFVG